jgi:endonuclease/exonuclease/phosphatase family metal-dependent hydrolase
MSQTFRIATFNCENLFNRTKIFEEPSKKSQELLNYVSELRDELSKEEFDHGKIKELEKKLRGYVTINDIRGDHEKAKGVSDWLGNLDFKTARLDDAAVDNTGRVISDVNADVICLIEVESRSWLQRFHDNLLTRKFLIPAKRAGYDYIMLIEGNDRRRINVSVMSKFSIRWLRSHIQEHIVYLGNKVPMFSRDCLEALISLPDDTPLQLLVNHFKSKAYSPPTDPQGNARRKGQVQRVAELAAEHDLTREYVVIAGDFNDSVESPALSPLLKMEGLYNVNLLLDPSDRWTYRTGNDQIDYILISNALKERLENVTVERHGIYSEKGDHYDTVTSRKTEASDHAAVVAEFRL